MLAEAITSSNSNSYAEIAPLDMEDGGGTHKRLFVPIGKSLHSFVQTADWRAASVQTTGFDQRYILSRIEIPVRVTEDLTIEDKMRNLSLFQKLGFLLTNKPSYLFYLGVSVAFFIVTIARLGVALARLFIKPANAAAAASSGQVAFADSSGFSSFVYFVVAIFLAVACYAAFVSKKPKDNTNGWDLIKFLSGSIIGLVSPVRIK